MRVKTEYRLNVGTYSFQVKAEFDNRDSFLLESTPGDSILELSVVCGQKSMQFIFNPDYYVYGIRLGDTEDRLKLQYTYQSGEDCKNFEVRLTLNLMSPYYLP